MRTTSNTISTLRGKNSGARRLTLSLPSNNEACTLLAFVEAMGWQNYIVDETPSREDILKECCGAWADDSRTTEELLADIRSTFNAEIIRDPATL